jgi:hypothetical protein
MRVLSADSFRILQILSALDMGKPSKITIKGGISIVSSNEAEDKISLPQTYMDIEGGTRPQKTGRDSPVVV